MEFDDEGRVVKMYDVDDGKAREGMRGSLAGQGVRVEKGVSGEAIAILREPGKCAPTPCWYQGVSTC